MRRVVFDIETNGLLDKPDLKVHSLVLRDLDSDAVVSCTNAPACPTGFTQIEEGLRLLAEAERIYGHNIISFDIPALKKVYPWWKPTGAVMDTFVAAGTLWPEEHISAGDYERARKGTFPTQHAGSHKLEAWGHRLGLHKGEYTQWCKDNDIDDPWANWSPEMQTYCEQDTAVTKALVRTIQNAGLKKEPIETEMELKAYLAAQERNGVPFDVEAAQRLHAKLAGRREELGAQLREAFIGVVVRDGGKHADMVPKRDNKKLGIYAGCPYTKIKIVDFSPSSGDHIANRLQILYGWTPEKFTDGGKPQVDEKTLKGMKFPEAPLLIEYLTLQKRLGLLSEGKQAWLGHTRINPATGLPHIHGRVKPNRCVTHRASHSSPNLGQVPKVGKPFGSESRALFHVPDGWVMIGADASGLELRCLAHYMAKYDGGAYGRVILEGRNEDGTDIHSVNMRALGLEGKAGRDAAKTFIYAFLYGAGDEKLGSILEPGASTARKKKLGKELKAKFLKNTPALKYLIDDVKAAAKKNGYLVTLDGRKVYVRHEHAALNTLLQTAGAIICKRWIVEFNRRLIAEFGEQGWDGQWAAMLWVHDEVQLAVRPEIAPRVCEILLASIRAMTQHFNFRVPLDGEAKTGRNWMETH